MSSAGKIKALALSAFLCAFALLYPLQPAYAYTAELPDDIIDAIALPEPGGSPNTWDQWLYEDRGDYVSVYGYTGTEDRITIPAEINGMPVREISSRNMGTEEDPHYSFFEDYNLNTSAVTVPEGVLSVAPYTFSGCLILNSIILPESLISIGNNAFAGCFNLTLANVPENVVEIGKKAFSMTGLTEIDLPQGLKIIGEGAFMSTHLTKISIPDSVIYIGKEAFYSSYIEEITLPTGLKKLESYLLSGCIRLKRVCISEGTETIDTYIFESCPNLEEVYFPSTLKEASQIFRYNTHLKSIYFASDKEECKLTLGNNIMDRLKGDKEFQEGAAEYYNNVQIIYNTPVPVTEQTYSKKPFTIDIMTVTLIAALIICLTLSMIFLTGFIREKKQTQAARAEKAKREEEAFHPEVLGAWECEKCKTLNSPIGKYCYKCGRKR